MQYIFELCPNCMDKLVERNIDDFQEYTEGCCPNCGSVMGAVLFGKEKAEDAIYKIKLNKVRDMGKHEEKCLGVIMKVSELDSDAAREMMDMGDRIIFEGDLLHTFLALKQLDHIEYMIDYTVIPNFPYAREFSMACPNCGEVTEYKVVYGDDGSVTGGFFCETCKDFVMRDAYSESDVDDTDYYIEASFEGVDEEVRKEILSQINYLWEKKIEGDKIKVRDKAKNIQDILGMMEACDIPYEIKPPYPHKIRKLTPACRSVWTEEDVRRLMEANPGLKITAEEMNALS